MNPALQREGASSGSLAGHRGSRLAVAEAQPTRDRAQALASSLLLTPALCSRFAPRTQCCWAGQGPGRGRAGAGEGPGRGGTRPC